MEAQGYDIKQNILFQDKHSAIRMDNNGNKSCTRNSMHIDISYSFVKYQVDSNNIPIVYCSTEHIFAYFFTKYLLGEICVKFREVIM